MAQGDKKQSVSFTLDPSVVDWLKAKAKELERSVSYIANQILKDRITQEQTGGKQ